MFRSFFFAGFECATGINMHGEAFDQVAATGHDQHLDLDYHLLDMVGLHAVREGVRWPLVDREGRHDFSTVEPLLAAAARHRMEVIWDLFHYGYPLDLDPLGPRFAERFAEYCHAVARFICARSPGPWYFTPMNEPSFFSWAAGEVGRFAPHLRGCGRQLKIALIRAAIRGIDAIRSVCPQARMVSVDPLCRVVPPRDRPELATGAWHFNDFAVFEGWDMLCGRLMPELGGSRAHLDLVGINYYESSQWEIGHEEQPLAPDDPRRVPLSELVRGVWERYGGELLITETSHVDEGRAAWIERVADEAELLLGQGVPLRGVCLYPVLGMPEWHARQQWARMGLWDLVPRDGALQREPHLESIMALRRAERRRLLRYSERRTRVRARAHHHDAVGGALGIPSA